MLQLLDGDDLARVVLQRVVAALLHAAKVPLQTDRQAGVTGAETVKVSDDDDDDDGSPSPAAGGRSGVWPQTEWDPDSQRLQRNLKADSCWEASRSPPTAHSLRNTEDRGMMDCTSVSCCGACD